MQPIRPIAGRSGSPTGLELTFGHSRIFSVSDSQGEVFSVFGLTLAFWDDLILLWV
jgi:hypothetical protein